MPKLSAPQLAGLKTIHELGGVKVWVAESGLSSNVSSATNYDKPLRPPPLRTIKALLKRGLVEITNVRETPLGTTITWYWITEAGKAAIGVK